MSDFLVSLPAWWEVIRFPLGAALCLAGGLLCLIGTVGVLRFPDFYTRLHAASITDTSGATLWIGTRHTAGQRHGGSHLRKRHF